MTSGAAEGARGAAARILIELARVGATRADAAERLAGAIGSHVDRAVVDACVATFAGEGVDVAWALLDDELFAAVIEAAQALDRGDVVAAALAHEPSSKARAKSAKKAAHRLRSRGVDVPLHEAPAAHATVVVETADEADAERRALITAPDGAGGRLIVIAADRADGVLFVEAIFRDEVLVRLAGNVLPRKKVRPMLRQLFSTWGDALASVDVSVGAAEILAADAQGHLDAPSLRDWLSELRPLLRPLARDARPLAEPVLDEDAVRRRASESAALFETPAFASWLPDRRALLDCGEKLHVAMASDLVINETQRHEQLAGVFGRAARDYLTEAQRRVLIARLRHASRFLLVRGDTVAAERAWAAARVLEEGGVPPFVEQLFRRVFDRPAPEQPVPAAETAAEPRSRLILPGAPDPAAAPRGGGLILP